MPAATLAAPKSQKHRVPVINAEIEVEAAPGERCIWLNDQQVTRHFGVFAWQKLGDGTYAPVVRVYDTLVRITEVRRIGIHMPWDTIRRLATAGFIESSQPAPGTIYVCIDSLMRHLEAAKDPEFWTSARRERYRAAIK